MILRATAATLPVADAHILHALAQRGERDWPATRSHPPTEASD